MKKSKLIIMHILIAIAVLCCTNVYAAVSATIGVNPTSATVERGQTFTVTLSLKNVNTSKKVESISGYINYNKNVIETLEFEDIQKDANGCVTIGPETLTVEDLTDKPINKISDLTAYVAFNGNPSSGNDSKIVIDFNNGISSNTDLIKINFRVKETAPVGDISEAITYKMFVVTENEEESAGTTEKINLTVKDHAVEPDPEPDPDPEPTVTYTELQITTPPTKTTYTEGESFNKAGMVVKAKYSDGSTKTISSYSVSPSGALKTTDTSVTVSYTENGVTKMAAQSITVNKAQNATLSDIEITSNPTKTTYTEGERFNTDGMVVKAKYSDGTTKTIAKSNYTVSPSGDLKTTDKSVTISFTEGGVTKTKSVNITVNAKPANNTANNNTANNTARNNTVNNTNTNKNATNTNTNNKNDSTATGKKIPATGAKMFILPFIVLAILTYISYNKYIKYKDI